MTVSDRSWQALEIITNGADTATEATQPPHWKLAAAIHEALWTYDCGPVTYLSLPGVTRQRTLVRAGSHPDPATTPPSLPDTDTTAVTPASQTLAGIASREFSERVGLSVVDVDTTPLGKTSAYTERLLTTSQSPSVPLNTTTPPLGQLLTAIAPHPHALSVVAERGDNGLTEVSVRFVDFTPTRQVHSRDALAASQSGSAPSVSDAFEGYTTLTNMELPTANGWEQTIESRLPSEEKPLLGKAHSTGQADWQATLAMELATTGNEYAQLFRRCPADPFTEEYSQLDVTARLTPGSESLPAFYPISTRLYDQSAWGGLPGRTTARITPVEPVHVPEEMSVADTDPTAGVTRTTPSEISTHNSAFVTTVLQWCLEQGTGLQPADVSCNGTLFVWADTPQTRRLIYLCSTETLQRAELITAATTAVKRSDLTGLTVFANATDVATDAVRTLLQPFQVTESGETLLYQRDAYLQSDAGVAVRPANSASEYWYIRPDNTLICHIGNQIKSVGKLSDSLQALAGAFPQARTEGNGVIVKDESSASVTQFESRDACTKMWSPIHQPARPATLATGLESATVLCQSGPNFQQVRETRSWDTTNPFWLRRTAAPTFLNQYTTTATDTPTPVEMATPEFISYLRHQVDKSLERILTNPLAGEWNVHPDDTGNRALRYVPPGTKH